MNESLLQFIWLHQLFNKHDLRTTGGESFEILNRGTLNTNQGPDFAQGRIRVGATEWIGSIELHRYASEWFRHQHHDDRNYQQVILHVVWENDLPPDQLSAPVFELNTRVPRSLLSRYEQWMAGGSTIPCAHQIPGVAPVLRMNWLERLSVERLTIRAESLLKKRHQPNKQWDEIFWQALARYFGGVVNGEAFERIAEVLPLRILERHHAQLLHVEALLLGQAGLLDTDFTDSYPVMLQKEYRFLKSKYRLPQPEIPVHFLRMRPVGFPTVRLAQLAMLLHQSVGMLQQLLQSGGPGELEQVLDLTANDYWHYRYRFDEPSGYLPKQTGKVFRQGIIRNACCPVLFAMGMESGNLAWKQKAINWMSGMPAERNRIVDTFIPLGIKAANSFESQGLIQLKTAYCDMYRCLSCAIGTSLLRHAVPQKS